jgi:hypothetical protein
VANASDLHRSCRRAVSMTVVLRLLSHPEVEMYLQARPIHSNQLSLALFQSLEDAGMLPRAAAASEGVADGGNAGVHTVRAWAQVHGLASSATRTSQSSAIPLRNAKQTQAMDVIRAFERADGEPVQGLWG